MRKQILYGLLLLMLFSCSEKVKDPRLKDEYPAIYPDYIGTTIPASIAPMNFNFNGCDNSRIQVKVEGANDAELTVNHKHTADFPIKKWHKMLEENQGDSLLFTVSVKQDGQWTEYKPFPIYISNHSIDYGLVYRKIAPGYEVYSKMGIYERDLSTFKERAIVENTLSPGMCVNCHAVNKTDPSQLSLHIRGANGGTILQSGNKLDMLNTKTDSTISNCVYPYWHPGGQYIAYSVNETRQSFHAVKDKRIEVIDLQSDVVIYHPESNELILSPALMREDAFETFPVFSHDGTKLYFCSAERKSIPSAYKDIKYNLCSIDFNPLTGELGTVVDTLINARDLDKSITFPRPSYDGKYIMFTMSDYGNFSIWHKEANLWLLSLTDNSIRPMHEVNSENTESFHNWTSDSRWFVFSSRRGDGLYTRLYLAGIDDDGNISKPFLLPQKNPKKYYDLSTYSYNVPDFVNEKMEVDIRDIEKKINQTERTQINVRL